MLEQMHQLLVDLQNKGYRFTDYTTESGKSFIVFWNEIKIVGSSQDYPCDTTICFKTVDLKPPSYSEYAIFSTFICYGLNGSRSDSFNQAIDTLNYYNNIGKFVRDCRDGSQDVLFVTNECVSHLTSELVAAHIDYHAKIKAKVILKLEKRG